MTGEKLYALYVEALMELQNCACDDWYELDDSDQAVWNHIAKRIEQ